MLFIKTYENIQNTKMKMKNCSICKGTGFVDNSTKYSVNEFMNKVKDNLYKTNTNNPEFADKFLVKEEDILRCSDIHKNKDELNTNNNLFELCNAIALLAAKNQHVCKKCEKLGNDILKDNEKIDSICKELCKFFDENLVFDSLINNTCEVNLSKTDYKDYDSFIKAYAEACLLKHKFEDRGYRVGIFNLYDLIQNNINVDTFNRYEIVFLFNIGVANDLTTIRLQYLQNLTSFFKMKRIKVFYHYDVELRNNKFLDNLGIKKEIVSTY